MTPEERQQFDEMKRTIDGLKNVAQLDPDIKLTIIRSLTSTSSKGADSEDQSVNESGSSNYIVLKDPVGFIDIDGKHIPYYNA